MTTDSTKALSSTAKSNGVTQSKAPKTLKTPQVPKATSTSNTPKKPKAPKKPKKPTTPKVDIEIEIDAAKHHAALMQAEGGDQYEYDPKLTTEECRKHAVRNMSGRFVCSPCKSKNQRIWGSGIICTELFLSRNNTYRAVINAQKCKSCNQYGKLELDVDKYVEKVLDTFALWRGLREPRTPDPHESRGPHDSSRCRGCEKGICTLRDSGLRNNNNNNNKYLGTFIRGRY